MAIADTARLIASLELKGDFSKKIGEAERSLGKLESRGTRAGRQIGTGILRGAALAVTGITAFGGVFAAATGHASDLNETLSKTGVVFDKSAPKVLAFGKDSAAALGLSQNAALGAASTYGNLFVSMGLGTDKAADMSIKMVTLASDLASFNNASPEDTLLALRAGLVGETEPLRKFGINLNDAALRQKALELGLVKTTKKVLPPAVKAQAAYALILEQSTTAQGDFERTQGGLANQTRILKANFTDLAASLAAPALPKIALIFQRINQLVKENQPEIAKLGDKIAGLFTDENITSGFNILKEAFQVAKETAPVLADAARITGSSLKIAVDAFKSLPPELQKLAIAGLAVNKLTGGLVTNIAGGLISAVLSQFKPLMNVNAGVVNVNGAVGGVGGAAGGAASGLGAVGATGLGATLAALAAPIAVAVTAAIASHEVTQAVNRETGANFQAPGSGPFGIPSALNNIAEAIKLLQSGGVKAPSAPIGTPQSTPNPDRRDEIKAVVDKQNETNNKLEQNRLAVTTSGNMGVAATTAGVAVQAALLGSQIATTMMGTAGTTTAVYNSAGTIVSGFYGAVRSLPVPVVRVTNVTKNQVSQNYYGPGGGSADTGGGWGGD